MNYIQYMKPGSKFWALPNGQEDVSWSEFWSNWEQAIAKAKDQIIDKWENLKQDYKDAADPIAASERKQAESIEATRAKQASMKFVSDNRTDYEKKRDRKNFKLKEFEQKEQQNKDATDAMMWTLTGIPYAVQHLASPNGVVKTYGNTKAAVQNGGGPYLEKAVASAAGDVLDAAILTAPLFTPEAQLARQLNKNIKEGIQLGQYYHGSPNRSIAQFKVGKDGGIYFTPSKDAAKQYTGLFGTGKVYNANLNLGDNVVTIDNGGRPWTKIPEEVVAKEFGITKQQVHDIIGSYNLGETPWHYGLTKHFGYRPKNNYYAIDQVVRLGKDQGVTGLVIQNARDNGKRLFSKNIPYDQTIVFDPKQITLNPLHAADEAVLRGQLGWAPKQTIPYRHGSLDPELQTFVPKYDRWDVTTHGADPYMYFVTDQSTPVSAANMMDLRPYQYTGNIVAEKPMVQVGDFNVAGKNATRNQLISRARQQGADAYLLQDIVDNKVPHQNVVARFIGPEGEAVQGGAASVKWYGPTMGKTTAAKVSDKLVDIDPLLKPIRAKHAERLGLKISDPKVSADPAYKQEVADFILDWRANPENQGKTLVASTKHLLDPQYKVEFANKPSIPDFETFAARNKARGFKETDDQLRAWYNSILEQGRELNIDNRYVSNIEGNINYLNCFK